MPITVISKKNFTEISPEYLKNVDMDEVKAVVKECSAIRANSATKGYDRTKYIRGGGWIPADLYWKNRKWSDKIWRNPDRKEGEKLRRQFLRTNPQFRTSEGRI